MSSPKFSPSHNPYRHTIGQGDEDESESLRPLHCSTPIRLSQSSSILQSSFSSLGRHTIFTERRDRWSTNRKNSILDSFSDSDVNNNTSLTEQLSALDNSQLIQTLEESIVENSNLKKEIVKKTKKLKKCHAQIKALIRVEQDFGDSEGEENVFPKIGAYGDSIEEESDVESNCEKEIQYSCVHKSLSRFTFFSGIDVDHAMLRYQIASGIHIMKQISIGGMTGTGAAFLVSRFGKFVITALGGGTLIMAIACNRGYVDVNWSEVYEALKRHQQLESGDRDTSFDLRYEDWTAEKIEKAKSWISNHSYTVAGFLGAFVYKLM